MVRQENQRRQGKYWLLTIKADLWTPCLPDGVCYIKGQREIGSTSSYEHWQTLVITTRKQSLAGIKSLFGINELHAELTYSQASEDYVWKEDTRVEGTQFEFGSKPFRRNSKQAWQEIWDLATRGELSLVEPQVRICHYGSLRRISYDHVRPTAMERTCMVFWGKTGTGKSRRAWEEATMDAYPKDPRTKFWDGYQGQQHVVIDEFRGDIDISHMLRWLDRYPVIVETKGSATVLKASKIWITSNLSPREWYRTIDQETEDALIRRLEIIEFQ